MHELGIVIYVAKEIDKIAEENNITEVSSVTLQVGEVSGIVTDYFADCWDYFKRKHPLLQNSELILETIPAVTFCEECGKTYGTVKFGKTCPYCGSGRTYLLRGREVLIKEIAVPDGFS